MITKRYLSLDILRGITVMLMILVNHPGSWSHIYAPLRHSAWDGLTPTDLVFPFFLFCTGVSMAFALSRYESLDAGALKKIFKRTALLFLTGLALNACSCGFRLSGLRVFGVLQRIALCYCLGAVLALTLKKTWRICAAAVVLGVLYTAALLAWGEAGAQFTLEGNVSGRLDIALVGEAHVYHGYGIPFDPEGLLGCLTGTCTVLLGYLIGQTVREGKGGAYRTALRILISAAVCIALSAILSIWIPVNKPLWSVSYVLCSGGLAMAVLSALIAVVDGLGAVRPFEPARWYGCNPLELYVLAELISICNGRFGIWWSSDAACTTNFLSLCYAVAVVLLLAVPARILYKKRIFIKF